MPQPVPGPYGNEEVRPAWFKTLGCLAASVLIGAPVLFGLLITGVFWVIFSLLYQLVAVSWPLWIVFAVVQVLVKNNKLPIMAGMRWWAVSATFVHAFIILGLFDESLRRMHWGPGPPNHLSTWGQLLLGALLALPIGAVAFYAQRGYCRYRLTRSS